MEEGEKDEKKIKLNPSDFIEIILQQFLSIYVSTQLNKIECITRRGGGRGGHKGMGKMI